VAKPKHTGPLSARRYFVSGRVQGVGFRYFVEWVASDLRLAGYTRNLADGRVEVYAVGPPDKLSELAGLLWKGPRMADVRSVEEHPAQVIDYTDFRIELFS
jgi:acylphosphatase